MKESIGFTRVPEGFMVQKSYKFWCNLNIELKSFKAVIFFFTWKAKIFEHFLLFTLRFAG